ncbi:MAG: hypothetical protein LBQ24_07160 [Candidatus Peribacteria bacterium]|nr:hypothetical protein [Candidatus Peribacteria bacterium]
MYSGKVIDSTSNIWLLNMFSALVPLNLLFLNDSLNSAVTSSFMYKSFPSITIFQICSAKYKKSSISDLVQVKSKLTGI